jgi:hypothetical protein
VRIAVPPDLVGFAETAGLEAVSYGLDTQAWLGVYRDFWTCFMHSFLEGAGAEKVVARNVGTQ